MSLIVVSNRVVTPEQQPGGLIVALSGALQRHGGTWVGWSGECSASRHARTLPGRHFALRTFDLTPEEHEGYYLRHANDVLWPLLHMRADLLRFDADASRIYERVNEVFAQQVLAVAQPGDGVWVHDYHLIPLGRHLRAAGFTGRIGFFLHVPFPPREVVQTLPGHRALFAAMADYDHIGFQTPGDVQRFRAYVDAELASAADDAWRGLSQRVAAHPASIATRRIQNLARTAVEHEIVRNLRGSVPRSRLIIGVDRLDYSKGLLQRLRAFSHYLERPDADKGMTMLQIATPTRSDVPIYERLHDELDRLVGTINGQHADAAHTPVRYVNQAYPIDVLAGFFRAAHMGLVTPLRDGMNLVAKEYVAAQDEADPGVLILSRFAGAASELSGALLVNPYDVEEMAEAIATAHAMPLAQRRERWQTMMSGLLAHDVDAWADDFIRRMGVPQSRLKKVA